MKETSNYFFLGGEWTAGVLSISEVFQYSVCFFICLLNF
jgi:hypothetical protein